MSAVADLELDLEVFSGPFDLLLTLVLREEVDLLEVELADVVLTYLDFLEARGELDLEVTTEFLVLIAALLELKSRLMLPREEDELLDVEPVEAAEELLARMIEAAPLPLGGRAPARPAGGRGGRPLPRRAAAGVAARDASWRTCRGASTSPPGSAPRWAGCCATRRGSTSRTWARSASRSPSACAILRALLRAGATTFDEAVQGADRVTVCITLFALLEMYKQGEATWDQAEPFGEIVIAPRSARRGPPAEQRRRERAARDRRGAALPLARAGAARRLAEACEVARRGRRLPALGELREASPRATAALILKRGRRRLDARDRPARRGRRPAPAGQAAHAAADARAGRDARRSSPTCSRSRGRRSPASAAWPPTARPRRCSSAA